MTEYQFVFIVYPLNGSQADALREAFQQAILAEIERQGLYMSPLIVEAVKGGGDGEEIS
ncbi:MAG: hypothetical protein AB1453_14730 [Chloroflexota bacterium]